MREGLYVMREGLYAQMKRKQYKSVKNEVTRCVIEFDETDKPNVSDLAEPILLCSTDSRG